MFKKFFSKNNKIVISVIISIIFAGITLYTSWQSDDAYHAYIMAKHLVEGKGFVYNVGYRVSATTCPLYTLIVALMYALSGHMFVCGIVSGVLFSSAAFFILLYRFCYDAYSRIFSFILVVCCYCFMSYTTAGLENSLLFLLGGLFLSVVISGQYGKKELFVLALLLASIAMTRIDAVLLFVPLILDIYFLRSRVKFRKKIGIGFSGLLPFILWELFSIVYYGFPFPNTFYAKLYTGFPTKDYIERGLDYLFRSWTYDLILFLIPIAFIALVLIKKVRAFYSLSLGLVLYILYVVYIGGDFMIGRHLTVIFYLGLCGLNSILALTKEEKIEAGIGDNNSIYKKIRYNLLPFLCIVGLMWRVFASPWYYSRLMNVNGNITGVGDEKAYWYEQSGGTIPVALNYYRTGTNLQKTRCEKSILQIAEAIKRGDKGYYSDGTLAGMTAYYASDYGDIYLSDPHGLMDPFIAHLPAVYKSDWRVGHAYRECSDGYKETVIIGKNLLVDKDLKLYYDKLLMIMSGDILNAERLLTIWKMNTGRYDYLLENYETELGELISD